jgi:apolipoprotein D and lipocalin family protein
MGKIIISFVALFLLMSSCKGQNTMMDKTVVKELELEKFLGKWHELYRYDHSFERGLVGVTAEYSMRKDGKIKVVNSGFKETLSGERSEAIGKAKIPNRDFPSKLKVSFFWVFYGDYFVLELDDDYQWAIVGSSSDKYLWILSRTPQIDESLKDELFQRLTQRAYDVDKLIKVEQKVN